MGKEFENDKTKISKKSNENASSNKPSQEFIEQIRKQRLEKQQKQREEQEKAQQELIQTNLQDFPECVSFPVKRRMLNRMLNVEQKSQKDASQVQREFKSSEAIKFTLCTYNMLAQTLVNRTVYPLCSSKAIQWKPRRDLLTQELKTLRADIFCLQEVDTPHWESHWRPLLESLGYQAKFVARKRHAEHGCAICWKNVKFRCVKYEEIHYNEYLTKGYHPDSEEFWEFDQPNVAQIIALLPISPLAATTATTTATTTASSPTSASASFSSAFSEKR